MVTTQNSGGGNYRHHRGESPSPTSRRPSCHSWWWCGSSHPCWTGCLQVVLLLLSFMVQPCVLAFLCADLLLVLHNQGQSQFPILSFKVKAFPSFLYLSTGKRLSTGKLGPGQFGPGAQLSWAQFAWNQASLSFPGKAPLLRNLKAFSRCLSV